MQHIPGDSLINKTEQSKERVREGCFTKINAIVSVIGAVITALGVVLAWYEVERPLPPPPHSNISPPSTSPPPDPPIKPVMPDSSVQSPSDIMTEPPKESPPPDSQPPNRIPKDITFINGSKDKIIIYVRYGSEGSCRSKPQSIELRVDPGQTTSFDSGGSNACFCLKLPERRTCPGDWHDAKAGSTQHLQ